MNSAMGCPSEIHVASPAMQILEPLMNIHATIGNNTITMKIFKSLTQLTRVNRPPTLHCFSTTINKDKDLMVLNHPVLMINKQIIK